jgi:50S ribosomal protein L16 3-hydroxylase
VGFRAPSEPDVLLRFLELAVNAADPERRYADAGLGRPRHAGEIDAAALERLRAMVERATRRSLRSGFARQMGMLLTEPRNLQPEPSSRRVDPLQVRKAVRAGCGLAQGPRSRLAFVRRGRGALLFADGRAHELDARLAFAAALLADRRRVPAAALRPHLASRRFLALVAELIETGALVLE